MPCSTSVGCSCCSTTRRGACPTCTRRSTWPRHSGCATSRRCAHNYRGSARLQLGDRVGEAELLESIELARSLDNQEYVLRGYYNLVEGLWRLDDLAQAERYLAAAEDYVRDRDFPVYTYMCTARRLRLLAMRGRGTRRPPVSPS